MAPSRLRIGLVGAGDNMRRRHIPGLRAVSEVEIRGVCNRRSSSTEAVAREFSIPNTYSTWQELVADPEIDAIVIGTWPYLHAAITIAALDAGKHVLCEARMAMTAGEAHRMLDAHRRNPTRVAQLVPSPYGLKGDAWMRHLISDGYLGELREFQVVGMAGNLADPGAPLSWRQDAALSGVNMLTLGILHETLIRWIPGPRRVMAQAHAFIPMRADPESGLRRTVGTPDSVQVMTVLPNGARGTYHLSGVTPVGGTVSIRLFGSDGMLHYDLANDRIFGSSQKSPTTAMTLEPAELPIPPECLGGWQVESDFIASIREGQPVTRTDFPTGVRYMEFTEAVATSAQHDEPVESTRM